MEDDLWRRGVEMSRGREQFSVVYRKWQGRGSLKGEGFGVAPPRCRRCGRLDGGFEEEWISVYRRLRGGARSVQWDVEEKLEGVMRDIREGLERGTKGDSEGGVRRKLGEMENESGRAFEVWIGATDLD